MSRATRTTLPSPGLRGRFGTCTLPGMGEGRTGDASASNRRLTVTQAAAALSITEAAVRGRVKRGTLRSYREGRTVYVLLTGGESASKRDESHGESGDQSELIAVLREQLAAEREANRENRRIIAGLVQRIPELEATPEPRDEPETSRQDAGGAHDRGDDDRRQTGAEKPSTNWGRSQEETERRPWWRRIFGG
jgi:hypothetical protein